MKPLVITGPTGAGKSAVALAIAERYGARLLSMDAMQVYRGMDIGTAKATPDERARVPHHLVDVRAPDEPFTAADFAAEVDRVAAEHPGQPLLLCGGTVFYLRAWWSPLVAVPPTDPALRARLEELPDPWAALNDVDPTLAARLHPNDRVRIVRGLEVYHLAGRPLSTLHAEDPNTRRDAEVVWLDRDDLNAVLDARVLAMMDAGYLDEVRRLLDAGWARTLKPMLSLGYEHLAAHLAGELPLDEAVRRTQRDTRYLAKKQRGFLRSLGLAPMSPEEAWAAAARAFGPP